MVLSKRGTHKAKWFLGPWRRRASREVDGTGNSHVFPSSGDRDSECSAEEESNCATSVKITRIKRVGSFRSLLHSNFKFLATMQEGFRLSVPWSKREKKGGFVG
ncbi:Detected protein of unknown function [Hibiscus syriacus]|uniref:Uncharacterized protein n=2 Tax=Hibiscus syriacus TaxID=106335 RepID=A0A6A2WQW7_HIBSY|nr:Detected protein of unknown function [Hibiscus syriacus]